MASTVTGVLIRAAAHRYQSLLCCCAIPEDPTHAQHCPNSRAARRYLNDLTARFKRPVWLTETACPNPGGALANQVTYMRAALGLMDAMPSIERCAGQGGPASSLLHAGRVSDSFSLGSDSGTQMLVSHLALVHSACLTPWRACRYAWFSPHAEAFAWLGGGTAGSPSLLTPGGALTALGRIYLGLVRRPAALHALARAQCCCTGRHAPPPVNNNL